MTVISYRNRKVCGHTPHSVVRVVATMTIDPVFVLVRNAPMRHVRMCGVWCGVDAFLQAGWLAG